MEIITAVESGTKDSVKATQHDFNIECRDWPAALYGYRVFEEDEVRGLYRHLKANDYRLR